MTRAKRENELHRLVTEHPGWTTAQLAHVLSIPVEQADPILALLRNRGRIEQHKDGWRVRDGSIRAWRREDNP